MAKKTVIGADACPAGWFVTIIERGSLQTNVHPNFSALRDANAEADQILVDIPLGLPTDDRRACDSEARELLGCRGSSVFYPPSESAINCEDYQEANKAQRDSIGHGLSQQAFYIGDKIREVRSDVGDHYDGLVRESHPELCFAALNGQPIAYPKSSDLGRGLRLELLSQELQAAESEYQSAREEHLLSEVRRDDILDSMILAVAARDNDLKTVPAEPSEDEPRIYYPSFELPDSTPD